MNAAIAGMAAPVEILPDMPVGVEHPNTLSAFLPKAIRRQNSLENNRNRFSGFISEATYRRTRRFSPLSPGLNEKFICPS
jgi:hypothetical protein